MKEKNRFGKLLEHFIKTADITNTIIAQDVCYDVSYISKWINGSILPSEKSCDELFVNISKCIIENGTEEGKRKLRLEYEVEQDDQLCMVIRDHLKEAYLYVKRSENDIKSQSGQNTHFYPEMTVKQMIQKMQHPELWHISSLDVISFLDIMTMERESRFMYMNLNSEKPASQTNLPNVRFSLVIHIDPEKWDILQDTIFLIAVTVNMMHINYHVYNDVIACGKAVMSIKDQYVVSGMLIETGKVMSVLTTENSEYCKSIYNLMLNSCVKERQLMQRVGIADIIEGREYLHYLLSTHQKWMLGHLNEFFLSQELLTELFPQIQAQIGEPIGIELLWQGINLSQSLIRQENVQVVIFESAFSDLIIQDEAVFFNCRIKLTKKQQRQYLCSMLELLEEHPGLKLEIVFGQLPTEYNDSLKKQSLFVSDIATYLQIDNNSGKLSIEKVIKNNLQKIFREFIDQLWNIEDESIVMKDREKILEALHHFIYGMDLLIDSRQSEIK